MPEPCDSRLRSGSLNLQRPDRAVGAGAHDPVLACPDDLVRSTAVPASAGRYEWIAQSSRPRSEGGQGITHRFLSERIVDGLLTS